MFTLDSFKFQTNVSLDTYQSKTDATACLSSIGAKAISKDKMAFKVQSVTVNEFLSLATSGHAFCNLFQYDPNRKYWFDGTDGKKYFQYPEYQRGLQKGAMKLCMKSDKFFAGAQTVFVDIDFTRYVNVADYLSTLTYPPTCVYMSFSDKKEKQGRTSRRFRMVYIFDKVLNREEFGHVSQAINDQIVLDTAEPMDDDCGTRMSQYMNGVCGNNETYNSSSIYSITDFPVEPTVWVSTSTASAPTQQGITFDDRMLADMRDYSTADFLHFYSWKYPYLYRIEKPDWIDGLYQLTNENYLQLWWYRERVVDGQHRRRKLFKNACLRRLMFPDMTPDAALYNLYIDFVRFFGNSDGVITPDCLRRKVTHAFLMTQEQLTAYCDYEITYWQEHRPQFIVQNGHIVNWGVIAEIRKRIRWNSIAMVYDRTLSVQENIKNGINIPQTTLYRYCKENFIATDPHKGMTEAEKREEKRQVKKERIELFMRVYNPSLTIRENQDRLQLCGLSLSVGTISAWSHEYCTSQQVTTTSPADNSIMHFDITIPTFDYPFTDDDTDVDVAEPVQEQNKIEDMPEESSYSWSWFVPDCNWQF